MHPRPNREERRTGGAGDHEHCHQGRVEFLLWMVKRSGPGTAACASRACGADRVSASREVRS